MHWPLYTRRIVTNKIKPSGDVIICRCLEKEKKNIPFSSPLYYTQPPYYRQPPDIRSGVRSFRGAHAPLGGTSVDVALCVLLTTRRRGISVETLASTEQVVFVQDFCLYKPAILRIPFLLFLSSIGLRGGFWIFKSAMRFA